jgi:hypothetical protein
MFIHNSPNVAFVDSLFMTMKEVVQIIMFMPLMLFLLDKNVLLVMLLIEKGYMLS